MNCHKLYHYPLVLGLVVPLLAACSTNTMVKGTIFLSQGQALPLPGATVALRDATLEPEDPSGRVGETTTDAQGYYAFTNVKAGTYILVVHPDLSSLPADMHCQFSGLESTNGWFILSGNSEAGAQMVVAILESEFDISAGETLQYDLDFNAACKP